MMCTVAHLVIHLLLIWIMNGAHTIGEVKFYSILMHKRNIASVSAHNVNTSMSIQKGIYPNTTSSEKSFKIGEPVSILIRATNLYVVHDITVYECWGQNEQYFNESTIKVKLTHPRKENAPKEDGTFELDTWKKIIQLEAKNRTVLLFTNFTAFKFPQHQHVYINCTVQFCFNKCGGNVNPHSDALSKNNTLSDAQYRSTPVNISGKFFLHKPKPVTPSRKPITHNPLCPSGKTDVECISEEFMKTTSEPTTLSCNEGMFDPRCYFETPSTTPAYNPLCPTGSIDPRCAGAAAEVTTTQPTLQPANCNADAIDPRCISETVSTTVNPPGCSAGSIDPRCVEVTESVTTESTLMPSLCTSESIDPRCIDYTQTVTDCGSDKFDPRCVGEMFTVAEAITTQSTPIDCGLNILNLKCVSTTPSITKSTYNLFSPPNCYPGTKDPRCVSTISYNYNSLDIPNCYPGSRDIRCLRDPT